MDRQTDRQTIMNSRYAIYCMIAYSDVERCKHTLQPLLVTYTPQCSVLTFTLLPQLVVDLVYSDVALLTDISRILTNNG